MTFLPYLCQLNRSLEPEITRPSALFKGSSSHTTMTLSNQFCTSCSGKLLLALASTVILSSKSHRTLDHILLSHNSGSHTTLWRVSTTLLLPFIQGDKYGCALSCHSDNLHDPLWLQSPTLSLYLITKSLVMVLSRQNGTYYSFYLFLTSP